ncbi:MAG: 1-deoxy-D-xylulose-5-phosphate synthase [Bacteroidales bacterium]
MQKLLDTVNNPTDLKKLKIEELPILSEELRQYIIDVIANHPGHLASSLGTVELSVALHYVFNTPYDRIVWDVGHQAYPHKILTERKDRFYTNRMYHGLSGFPSIKESPYDPFGTGHSSTSISATLGMAVASQLKGETTRQHIAIIGDGAMTGGLAFEGLNNAGISKSNILVILNDNGISIDKSTGALNKYFTKIATSHSYNSFKNKIWHFLGDDTDLGQDSRTFLSTISTAFKSLFFRQSNLFESLNFRYFGPVDGHDVKNLVKVLNKLKNIQGPKILHIITKKGKGLERAEKDPILYHAPGKFDSKTGKQIIPKINLSLAPKYQDVFGKTMIELAQKNPAIVAITPAMPTGCSLHWMMDKMPERVFDVGIAEQHAVTFAAGLASQGMIPFCNIYSSFMQRAYDQIIHDVALQHLQVVLCLDRGGLVGEDGATHHGAFDLAYLNPIPNLIISAPMNEAELRSLMFTAQSSNKGPFVIRYPRGRGVIPRWKTPLEELPIGKGRNLQNGENTAILSIGHIGNSATQAIAQAQTHNLSIGHYDMRYLKPLDEELLHQAFKKYKNIITLEDGVIKGGLGSSICDFAIKHHYTNQICTLGLPDYFVSHGSMEELQRECKIDVPAILATLLSMEA